MEGYIDLAATQRSNGRGYGGCRKQSRGVLRAFLLMGLGFVLLLGSLDRGWQHQQGGNSTFLSAQYQLWPNSPTTPVQQMQQMQEYRLPPQMQQMQAYNYQSPQMFLQMQAQQDFNYGSPQMGVPHSNLFVGNLGDDASEQMLQHVFGTFGTVASIKLVPTKKGGKMALVKMSSTREAEQAIQSFGNQRTGKQWMVKSASSDGGPGAGSIGGGALTVMHSPLKRSFSEVAKIEPKKKIEPEYAANQNIFVKGGGRENTAF